MDMLLALYDKAIEKLDLAAAELAAGRESDAVRALIRVQQVLQVLAHGVRVDVNEEVGVNMLRLYAFAADQVRAPRADGVAAARGVLITLREGFEAVRDEANALERAGRVPSADAARLVLATA